MKRKHLFGCMAALTLLLTASCSSDPGVEGPFGNEGPSSNGVSGEEMEVTFAVDAENLVSSTRAGETTPADPARWQTISKGKKIDRLIYAVYELNETEDADGNKTATYTLLTQYGKGYIKNDGTADASHSSDNVPDGQTIVWEPFQQKKDVGDTEDEMKDTYTFSLRLMRNKTYSIAFWAQSSKTEAYDTENLRQVEVKYPDENDAYTDTCTNTNNNEYRDAFCKVETFSVISSTSRNITLTRPFAQINVGTTGADYKSYGEEAYGGHYYTASKIVVNGVARFMDVVADKVLTESDITQALEEKKEKGDDYDGPYDFSKCTFPENGPKATTTAYFGWAKIPAYINTEDSEIPTGTQCVGSESEEDKSHYFKDEEFLKIKLNTDETDPLPYMIEYPTIKEEDGTYATETFKYLSMCYVLVPASTEVPEGLGNLTSSVLDGVSVAFAPTEYKDETLTFDGNTTNSFSLTNVPVHRNWRTNILGGLTTSTTTPDPSSLFNSRMVKVLLDPDFDGEYNGTSGEDNFWEEYPKTSNDD